MFPAFFHPATPCFTPPPRKWPKDMAYSGGRGRRWETPEKKWRGSRMRWADRLTVRSIDGQSGDIIQPGNTFRTCFQNILKAILRSGWSNFSKMIALIYIFYYLYLNLMIPNCIWCIRLPWTLHLQKVPVEHFFFETKLPEQDACYNIVRHFRPLDKTF